MVNTEPNKQQVPVISIQCDWEDFIETPHKQIWVSCKFRDQSSVHGKIRGVTLATDSDDFLATLGRNSICIRHSPSNNICRFIPPFKVFNSIHAKGVVSLDVADGGLGVSVCNANKLSVWDNTTGQVRRELNGHVGNVYKCKLFPSGIVVLSGGADMQLKIWSAETGQCPVTLTGHQSSITDVAIVDRGRNIVSVSKDGTSKLWDCGKSSCIATILETRDTLNCCSIGQVPDGTEVVDTINEREIGTKDKMLLIGSEEGRIYGVALSTRNVLFTVYFDSAINAIRHFSQNDFVVGTQDGRILVCSLKDGCQIKSIHESNSPVLCFAPFKDKGVFVGRHDGTVTFFSMVSDTSDRLQLTGSDCDPIYTIASTESAVYVGCRDTKIRLYKVTDIMAGGV